MPVKPPRAALDTIVSWCSLAVLPVLGFIGMFMFNGLEAIKVGQADTNSHVAVLERTLPYVNDAVKRNSNRLDHVEDAMLNRTHDRYTASQARNDNAKRDAEIRHLQDVIKNLTASGPHADNKPLQDAQSRLAMLIIND